MHQYMSEAVKLGGEGQTLVEMVIAIGLVALVLVGLVAGTTASLKSARLSKERNQATEYAQAEIENARRVRDTEPETFFSTTGVTGPVTTGTAPVYSVTTTKTLIGNQMEVLVEVTWNDAGNDYNVTQTTYLTKWQ